MSLLTLFDRSMLRFDDRLNCSNYLTVLDNLILTCIWKIYQLKKDIHNLVIYRWNNLGISHAHVRVRTFDVDIAHFQLFYKRKTIQKYTILKFLLLG